MDEKKKKICMIIAAVVVLIGLIFAAIKIFSKDKVDEKERITKELETLGREYYEKYYYVSAGNSDEKDSKEKYLSNFTSVGLKINLENLLRYNNTLKKGDKVKVNFTNKDTNKKCNYEKSMVTIYPKKPYGKTDYKISVYVDCGFENEKK